MERERGQEAVEGKARTRGLDTREAGVAAPRAAARQQQFDKAREALLALIAKGGYRPGDQLPPEPELARQLGVSRATLRELLRTLEVQGVLIRRRGVGTFVNTPPITVESGLEVLESLEAIMRRRGKEVRTRDLQITEEPALPKAASRLQVPVGTPLVIITRTRLVDGIPVAWMMDAVLASVISVDEVRSRFRGSLLETLKERGEPQIGYAFTNVLAVDADQELAAALEVPVGKSLLFLEQVLYDTRNRPIAYERHYFVPGLVRFHVVRR